MRLGPLYGLGYKKISTCYVLDKPSFPSFPFLPSSLPPFLYNHVASIVKWWRTMPGFSERLTVTRIQVYLVNPGWHILPTLLPLLIAAAASSSSSLWWWIFILLLPKWEKILKQPDTVLSLWSCFVPVTLRTGQNIFCSLSPHHSAPLVWEGQWGGLRAESRSSSANEEKVFSTDPALSLSPHWKR